MIDISERLRDTPTWLNLLAIQPFTANVPYLNKYFALVYNYFKNTEQKRALQRGETLSDQAFKFTWSWEQFLYDWVYAPNGKPDVDHGPIMSSLWRFFVEDNDDRGFLQVPLPSSCSYARWAKEGVCSFDYAGFGPLFNADITIRTTFKKCGDPALPSIQLQCVGKACPALSRPMSCASNSQCPGGLVCRSLNGNNMQQFNFDPLFLTAIAQGQSSRYLNDTRNVNCTGSPFWSEDSVFFLDKLGQTIPGSGGVCQLNVTADIYYPGRAIDIWIRKVYEGIQQFPGYRLILLNYFSGWP